MAENAEQTRQIQHLTDQLNAAEANKRLDALRELKTMVDVGLLPRPSSDRDVNNHIHTFYSFSPYSPAKAVWQAWQAGLATAGIMDHDTIAGAREFITAGKIMGLPTTIGAECRASFTDTILADKRINNPDQSGVAYVALHGVPHTQIDALTTFFEPVREARLKRNRQMTARLNELIAPAGLVLDFDQDIVPLSKWTEGGQITERHLLFAVALKLIARFPDPDALINFMKDTLKLNLSEKARNTIREPGNPHLAYDVLGILKSDLVEKFYLDATDECPPIDELAAFAKKHGIILAYAYLGDVTNSVTGDKKAQQFEDAYLEELFVILKQKGFDAVTYMPSRNTREQLIRIKSLCEEHQLFQISGEDINQPRQAFICTAMRDPFFTNLYDAAWALIGHEAESTVALDKGMFAEGKSEERLLDSRIKEYSLIAQQSYTGGKSHDEK